MGKSTEMFKPAHVTEILDPESKKITQAEYIAALDWQKRNGYPAYSAEAVLIREYEKQNAEDRAPLYGQPISIGLQQKLKIENQKGKP